MKRRILVVIFALGVFVFLAILWLAIARQGAAIYITPENFLIGALGLVIAALVFMSIFVGGKDRWMALAFVGILFLLFSVLAIFSIGMFLAPMALLLLGFSLWKYRHGVHKRAQA